MGESLCISGGLCLKPEITVTQDEGDETMALVSNLLSLPWVAKQAIGSYCWQGRGSFSLLFCGAQLYFPISSC